MIKAILLDNFGGKAVEKFSPKVAEDLGKDVVEYLQALPKGNPLEPLEKDTFVFSTGIKHSRIAPDGTLIPKERTLFIEKRTGEGTGFASSASKTPIINEDGFVIAHPLTLEGVKDAIRQVFRAMKNARLD